MKIPFNKPYFTGKETQYIEQSVKTGKISGNGNYTKKCQQYFQDQMGFNKCLLTSSCTDALEMAALVLNINSGDEVIVPSFTFVSSALPFVMRGAKIVFADSRIDHPGINEKSIEGLITDKTKAIVIVHYAGVSADMKLINDIASRNDLFIIEDAAHCIDSYYKRNNGYSQHLGTLGHIGTFSFHETKNIISGEGGLITINDSSFTERSEIIWEKGTNRAAFFRGEVDKYGWVDVGSSFLPSEITAAFLYAQLEHLQDIQSRRVEIWERYYNRLSFLEDQGIATRPVIPSYATNNGHMFYLVFEDARTRELTMNSLKKCGIQSVFHYQSLHKSSFYREKHDGRSLPNADRYTDNLLRLPFFVTLKNSEIDHITDSIKKIFN